MKASLIKPGQMFGTTMFLKVVPRPEYLSPRNHNHYGLFKCECGNEWIANVSSVTVANRKCMKCTIVKTGKANATHGKSKTKEFKLWCAIKDRCLNTLCKEYGRYGGRGITMFSDWQNSFEAFIKWIEDNIGLAPQRNRYSSLERIENDKGYVPGNLKWATPVEQCRNRSTSLFVLYNDKPVNLKTICEEKGLPYHAVWLRINRRKWSVERSLDTPLIPNKKVA